MFRSLINNLKPFSRNFSVVNNVNRYEKLLFKHYEKVFINKPYKKITNKHYQSTDFYIFLNEQKIIITENIKTNNNIK